MDWNKLYGPNHQPDFRQILEFINHPLWQELLTYLEDAYKVEPKLSYSKCSMQSGWNVKYRKGGKSLCTLYPMPGYFIALVVIGVRETPEAELLLPLCSEYTKALFNNTPFSAGGRWLMIHVTNPRILEDVKELIRIRAAPSNKTYPCN